MSIQPRTSTVTIFQGDYLDEISHLRRKAEAARDAETGPRMMGEESEAQKLIAQHDALVVEAEKSAIHVKVRNLGRKSYHDLKKKHPPRDGEKGDDALGCNEETFFDELVPLSLVSVEGLDEPLSGDTDRQRFLEDLAPIDWERVKLAAWGLNETVAADPKLFPASAPTSESDAT